MTRSWPILTMLVVLSGCAELDWQANYDNLARSDCRANIDADDRRACLARVETNAAEHRSSKLGD